MSASTVSIKHYVIAGLVGAALTYGVIGMTPDDSLHREQIASLEGQILDLELSLSQKEEELADARFFGGEIGSPAQKKPVEATKKVVAVGANSNQQNQAQGELLDNKTTTDSQQVLRDLGTLSDRDPRSFSEKANQLLAGGASREGVALVSKSVFDMAENREILPDYELESLYQQQTDPDLKRVVAQVLSTRGDNRLIEKRIIEEQAGLKSENPADRQKALVELGKTRFASAANAIAPLLQDENNSVKLDALLALRATGNQSHTRLVQSLVNDPDPAVSWLAKDVISNLENLSEKARTQLANTDIVAELPVIEAP